MACDLACPVYGVGVIDKARRQNPPRASIFDGTLRHKSADVNKIWARQRCSLMPYDLKPVRIVRNAAWFGLRHCRAFLSIATGHRVKRSTASSQWRRASAANVRNSGVARVVVGRLLPPDLLQTCRSGNINGVWRPMGHDLSVVSKWPPVPSATFTDNRFLAGKIESSCTRENISHGSLGFDRGAAYVLQSPFG